MGHYASEMDGSAGPNHPQPKKADSRSCTCHPADDPPEPCAQRYATSECKRIEDLRKLVDIVYLHATESEVWPSTRTADKLIAEWIEKVGTAFSNGKRG